MHKCLYVSEIVANICSKVRRLGELDDSNPESEKELLEARQTLYRFALSCRAIKDPALDILWGDLDSLYPLLCCLPGLHTRNDDYLVISRALRASDLDIFSKYAKRVRSLGYSQNGLYMHKDMLRVLCSFPTFPNGSLLPNLRILSWECDESEVFPFIRYFLSPYLIALRLPGELWYAPKVSFMTFLRTHCPKLQQLSCSSPNRAASVRISDYICESQELRSIDCGLPSAAAMQHLMKLPSLNHLMITLSEGGPYDEYKGNFRSQLGTFGIHGESLTRIESFLSNIHLSPTHVILKASTVAEYSDTKRICSQLPKYFQPSKLQILDISISDIESDTDIIGTLFDLDVHAISGLFQFKNLVELRLEDLSMSSLDDRAMSAFVKSWPNIEVLKLGTGFDWRTQRPSDPIQRSLISLRGLTRLVSGCRKLRVLGLVFDAHIPLQDDHHHHHHQNPRDEKSKNGNGNNDWRFEFHPRHQTNENMQELDVGASFISSAVPVAVFISSLMPRLRKITSVSCYYTGGIMQKITDQRPRLWVLVGEMLESLAVVRKQGRREGLAGWVDSSDEEDV